jgi:putative transposon-encoded protein
MMAKEEKIRNQKDLNGDRNQGRVRFEVYGKEMVEKTVRLSGNSGRVYLPPVWVGSVVKIIRVD